MFCWEVSFIPLKKIALSLDMRFSEINRIYFATQKLSLQGRQNHDLRHIISFSFFKLIKSKVFPFDYFTPQHPINSLERKINKKSGHPQGIPIRNYPADNTDQVPLKNPSSGGLVIDFTVAWQREQNVTSQYFGCLNSCLPQSPRYETDHV